MNKLNTPISLRDHARYRISTEMMEVIKKNSTTPDQYLTLVTDSTSLSIFSSLFTTKDLPTIGISRVEKLVLKRKKLPNSEGIYLILPTDESVNLLISDFSDKKRPTFAKVHICILNYTPKDIMTKLSMSSISSRVVTFLEINLDFQLFDENVFYFSAKNDMKLLDPLKRDAENELNIIVDKLFTTCCALYEFPFIRYFNKSSLCKYIATNLNSKLAMFQSISSYQVHEPRGQLIIVDRTIDMCSCAMHDFNFMSIIYDMNVKKDIFSIQIEGGDIITLDEYNEIWEREKYSHYREALKGIDSDFQKFSNKNKAINEKKGDESQMNSIIRSMPEYQNLSKKLPKIMKLANNSVKAFNNRYIMDMTRMEQAIITGKNEKKDLLSNRTIAKSFENLKKDFPLITDEEIIRLLILYLSQYDILKKDINPLLNLVASEEWKKCLLNCISHGLIKTEDCPKAKRKNDTLIKDEDLEFYEKRVLKYGHQLILKTIPTVTKIIMKAAEQKYQDNLTIIGNEHFKLESTSRRGSVSSTSEFNTPRIMLFMLGGLSTTEIATTFNLKKEGYISGHVIMGSNCVVTPLDLLQSIIEGKCVQ